MLFQCLTLPCLNMSTLSSRMLHVMHIYITEMEYGKRQHHVHKCLMTHYRRQAIKIYYYMLYKI